MIKNFFHKFFFIFVPILLFSLPINKTIAQTIYVSKQGNDNNSGTYDMPLESLDAALKKVSFEKGQNNQKEVRIIVKKGEYYLNKPIIISDKILNEEYQLIIEGEKETMPVFKGSIPLGKFEKVTDILWKMDIGVTNFAETKS